MEFRQVRCSVCLPAPDSRLRLYFHNGQMHDYSPDFIVLLNSGVHLIIETKGYDPLENLKAAAAERWCNAVSADGSFGEWRYAVAHDPNAIRSLLGRYS